MDLSTKIKELREDKGMSLRDLSKKTGINPSYLYRLETGKQKNPSANTLERLSTFFNEELYFYTKEQPIISLEEVFKHDIEVEGRVLKKEEKDRIIQQITRQLI